MKLLFFIPNLSHGGAEKVLVNLVNHLDKDKYEITVQTLFDVGINRKFLNADVKYKYVFQHMPRGNIHMLKFFTPKQLFKYCIKDKYDIIVSYLEGPTARIIAGCTDPDVRLISWIHVEQQTREIACKAFRNYKEAEKCYEKFDKTICVSEAVKEDFHMLFGSVNNIEVLYNTIESEYIRKKAADVITDKRFTDYSGIKICAVGKISQRKGFMRLARIHQRLRNKGYEYHTYILGVGSEQEKIEKYLKENQLTESFIFLGYDENPYKFVKQSDMFVCSSLSEGFSTAATEALIVGTPVVTTMCAGMQELLGCDNEYGIITGNDEYDLEKGIERLLADNKLLEYYREKAVIRGHRFETDATVKAVENMLDTI